MPHVPIVVMGATVNVLAILKLFVYTSFFCFSFFQNLVQHIIFVLLGNLRLCETKKKDFSQGSATFASVKAKKKFFRRLPSPL
jgi:hypothetical protein